MDITIRPVRPSDAAELNAIRRMDGVLENILSLPSERESVSEEFIKGLGENMHMFTAECDGKVAGCASLAVGSGRKRHSGGVGIMVHKDYQGRGIGRALMEKLLDTADNWLMLKRVELEVYPDNERAIKLYESLGFVREGVSRASAIRNGAYSDNVIMGRIRGD